MSNNLREFKEKFLIEDLLLIETEYWYWSLRPNQATLGAGVLSLKRECFSFSGLYKEEFIDLGLMINIVEGTLSKSFKYDIINYLMLMMVDNQVHYHIIPRYKNVINFIDLKWIDNAWPGPPNLNGEKLKIKDLNKIAIFIRQNLIGQ